MSKIVEAVEAWYKQHGTPRVAPPHRPENTSQGIASSGHTWMRVRGPQRSRMATEKREPLSAQKRPCRQSPLSIKSASIFRAREAGTRAFKMRFSRPGTILERNDG